MAAMAAVGQKLCPGLGDVGLLPTLMHPDALKAAEQRLQRGLLGLLRVPQALGQRQCQGVFAHRVGFADASFFVVQQRNVQRLGVVQVAFGAGLRLVMRLVRGTHALHGLVAQRLVVQALPAMLGWR